MGLIKTSGNYCYVQCDRLNCNRKMEHVDLKLLKELARLCGWERDADRWTCPNCAEERPASKSPRTSQKPVRRELEA